jgi:hypothetical protein
MPRNLRFESTQLIKFLTTDSQGKSYATIAATIILMVVMFLIGVFPTISTIFQQNSINENRAAYLTKLEENLSALRTLGQAQTSLFAEVEALNAVLPTTLPQVEVISEISAMADELEVKLLAVSFSEVTDGATKTFELRVDRKVTLHQVKISARGSRVDLISFVDSLEKSKRIFDLTSASLIAEEGTFEDQTASTFRLDLGVDFYYWDINI